MRYELEIYGSIQGELKAGGNHQYLHSVLDLISTCERYNFTGILVQYNHKVPDPCLNASFVLQHSSTLIPLIAIQPYSIPPFTLAKTIASIAFLYSRKVALNMITGSDPKELREIGDNLLHDERYDRLSEYLDVLKALLHGETPLTYQGSYYNYQNLHYFEPGLDQDLYPKIFIPGSSKKSKQIILLYGDVAMTNPEPIAMFQQDYSSLFPKEVNLGIRVGIIARPTDSEAWAVAESYFPYNRTAYISSKFNRSSDSSWKKRLVELTDNQQLYDETYWLGAITAGESNSPFLVGSYKRVAEYLFSYIRCGVRCINLASPLQEYEKNAIVLNMIRHGSN